MYVKDLEIKSRYMEAECRRLGRLLQCCYAENQMLRISLGSAYGASMAIPESAVLLLESLLLVSLVWLMVNICLLPRLPLQNQNAVPHGSVERKELESATPKRKRMKVTELWVTLSFMRSKRCRASRTKMKSDFERAVLCN
ncbi:bZIP transcription factor 50-like [Chenopodium quinoa]|uniref:bZIP transcription factor 50-like n=1 Tax=Chenopodium quinoa TaxID=63459 RepID=UPI000B7859D5|nr:bZIP transcription factor 50-like [Chenopodium quinoa]